MPNLSKPNPTKTNLAKPHLDQPNLTCLRYSRFVRTNLDLSNKQSLIQKDLT